jgi:uncharacterized protein YebE (UPF0316 family)
MRNLEIIWASIILALLGFTIGLCVGKSIQEEMVKEAINKGYMIHNPTTGSREWAK